MRYDSEQKMRTRKRLLAEAAAVIRADGVERVALAPLMKKLGLTHGGFYAHFASKDDLVVHAIDEMFDDSLARFRARTEGLSAAAGLSAYVDFYLSDGHCEARHRGCALAAMAGDVPRLDAAARERFAAGTRRLQGAFAGLLQEAGHGVAEATDLASSVLSECSGALALARAVGDPEQSREIRARSRASVRQRLGLVEGVI